MASPLSSPNYTASGTSGKQQLIVTTIDNVFYIIGVKQNGSVIDPTNSLWNTIVLSDEAKSPFNIVTGQVGKNPIDFIAPQNLQFDYFDKEVKKGQNGASSQKEIGSSDSGFYQSGIVGGPKQFQQPGTSGSYGALNPNTKAAYAYPIDISTGQDHLMIKKYKYSGARGVNQSGPDGSVAGEEYNGFTVLPMPKVSDSNGAEWGDSDLNVFGVAGFSVFDAGRKAASSLITGGIPDIRDLATGARAGLAEGADFLKENFDGAAAVGGALGASSLLKTIGINVEPDTLLARSTGSIANPNAELLFQGPVLRDFGFQFLMIARSQEEGTMIRKIIRWFKEGAAPKYRNAALLGTPDIFRLKYVTPTNPGILNRFHDMALRTITVDYAPDGFWSAYEDAHPVACRMSLQFTELKPVYDTDYQIGPFADIDKYAGALESANGVGY